MNTSSSACSGNTPAPALRVNAGPGFNGQFQEPASGWQLLGNGYRAYNPVLMRFHSPDNQSPFGDGGLNAYAYCEGDPVNGADPTGHGFWSWFKGRVGLKPKGSTLKTVRPKDARNIDVAKAAAEQADINAAIKDFFEGGNSQANTARTLEGVSKAYDSAMSGLGKKAIAATEQKTIAKQAAVLKKLQKSKAKGKSRSVNDLLAAEMGITRKGQEAYLAKQMDPRFARSQGGLGQMIPSGRSRRAS